MEWVIDQLEIDNCIAFLEESLFTMQKSFYSYIVRMFTI